MASYVTNHISTKVAQHTAVLPSSTGLDESLNTFRRKVTVNFTQSEERSQWTTPNQIVQNIHRVLKEVLSSWKGKRRLIQGESGLKPLNSYKARNIRGTKQNKKQGIAAVQITVRELHYRWNSRRSPDSTYFPSSLRYSVLSIALVDRTTAYQRQVWIELLVFHISHKKSDKGSSKQARRTDECSLKSCNHIHLKEEGKINLLLFGAPYCFYLSCFNPRFQWIFLFHFCVFCVRSVNLLCFYSISVNNCPKLNVSKVPHWSTVLTGFLSVPYTTHY